MCLDEFGKFYNGYKDARASGQNVDELEDVLDCWLEELHVIDRMHALLEKFAIKRGDVGILGNPAPHGRDVLVSEAMRPSNATAQWHRRLFARFLAERGLLRHPEHGPVTLEDCEELAKLEGLTDAWAAAEAYGARMLPG